MKKLFFYLFIVQSSCVYSQEEQYSDTFKGLDGRGLEKPFVIRTHQIKRIKLTDGLLKEEVLKDAPEINSVIVITEEGMIFSSAEEISPVRITRVINRKDEENNEVIQINGIRFTCSGDKGWIMVVLKKKLQEVIITQESMPFTVKASYSIL
jgi:hypothetical protein